MKKPYIERVKLAERGHLIHYAYGDKLFPCIFVTADMIVTCAVKKFTPTILLVKRKDNGKWALPGGYVEYDETFWQTAVRELKEETALDVSKCRPVSLPGTMSGTYYDYPYRSTKGNRRITVAFYIRLGFLKKLPKVKAGDDAKAVKWIETRKIEKMKREEFHDDHWDIIVSRSY